MRIPFISLVVGGALALGGCAYDNYGMGFGYGAGYGGYYGDYAGPYYSDYGYGYGAPYFGWYDDFYYPGTGIYVYDSYRRPHRWNDRQRSYWTGRQHEVTRSGHNATFRENWSGFNRRRGHSG